MKNLKVREKVVVGLITTGIVGLALVMRAGFYCASVDHESEYCRLSDVLGLEHQADKINEGTNSFRCEAVYVAGDGSIDDFGGHADDHVTEIVHSTWTSENGFFDVDSLDKSYYVDDGYLKVYNPKGERVELYDTDDVSGKKLIRVFTKK